MVGAGLEVGRRLETTIAYQLQAKTRGTFTLTTPRPLPGESPKATVSSTPFFWSPAEVHPRKLDCDLEWQKIYNLIRVPEPWVTLSLDLKTLSRAPPSAIGT